MSRTFRVCPYRAIDNMSDFESQTGLSLEDPTDSGRPAVMRENVSSGAVRRGAWLLIQVNMDEFSIRDLST